MNKLGALHINSKKAQLNLDNLRKENPNTSNIQRIIDVEKEA